MTDDAELLRCYAKLRQEDAFTELVQRHVNLVWGTAKRITGEAELACDVSQLVFSDLAKKADALPHGTVLPGWLHRAACHAAKNAVRGNARRNEREKQAMELHALINDDGKDSRDADELQAILDDALAELPDLDRDAVLLRYFAKKSFAEIGTVIQSSEDAAQKRLSRALDKMRDFFRGRGVGASAGAVVAALGVAGTNAAPCGFAATVATASLAAGGVSLGSASILQTIVLMKTRIAIACAVAAAVAVPTIIQQKTASQLRRQNAAPQQQLVKLNTIANPNTIRIETINAMKQLGFAARLFAADHNHKHPTTFEEMKIELNGMATDRFEFVKHIREVTETEPQLILFREIEPRQLPGGSWERVYAFADGSAQVNGSPDGDFSAFEQEHMAKPLTAK